MKKKTNWKTLVALALAVGTWRKFSEDLPIIGGKPTCGYYEKAILEYDHNLGVSSWRCVIDTSIPRVGGR